MITLPASLQKWLPLGLLISIGINVFLGGFLLARSMNDGPDMPMPPRVDMRMRALPPDMPKDIQDTIQKSMREHRSEMRMLAREYRAQQREIERMMSAAQIDENELRKAYKELRALSAEMQGPIHEAIVHALKDIDPTARREFIEKSFDGKLMHFSGNHDLGGKNWSFKVRRDGDKIQIDTDVTETEDENGNIIILERKVITKDAPQADEPSN